MPNNTFYALGIGFASGVFFRSFFDIGKEGITLVFLISIACALLWFLRGRVKGSTLLIAGIFFLTLGLGIFRMDVAENVSSALKIPLGEPVELEGIVVREPDYRSSSVHLYVKLKDTDELILVTTDRFLTFRYGDGVRVSGELEKPESFETDLGRTFNYPGYLKARDVRYMMSYADALVVAQGEGNSFVEKLFDAKRAFIDSFELAVPEPMAGLGEGVLLGVKRALGEDLEQVFRDVGIIHIVVLSGYNVMIVVEWVMRLLALWFLPRTRMLIGIAVITGFAVLVGLSATVIRASIMASLLLIARTTGRTYAIVRALVLAGTVMLIHNPYLLAFDPGFALSFLATLGLILVAPLISTGLGRVPETFNVREFITATLATQLFVLPFLLYSMGMFSVVSVMVNVLVLPMVPVAMLLTFITGLAGMLLPILGMTFGFAAYLSLGYIIKIAELFAQLPFAAFSVPAFPFWVVIVCYTLMGVGLYYLHDRNRPRTDEEDGDSETKNDYEGWVIEEEKEGIPGASKPIGDTHGSLPFR